MSKTRIRAMLGAASNDDNQEYLQEVLDYIVELEEKCDQLEDDALKLQCLEEMGVDNWSFYDEAMDLYRQYKNEGNE